MEIIPPDIYGVCRQGGINNDRLILDKQLYYNNWFVECRFLQKELFPKDCNWDEEELKDREIYILMKDAIRKLHPRIVLKYKKGLQSRVYRQKKLAQHLHGVVSCLILFLYLSFRDFVVH